MHIHEGPSFAWHRACPGLSCLGAGRAAWPGPRALGGTSLLGQPPSAQARERTTRGCPEQRMGSLHLSHLPPHLSPTQPVGDSQKGGGLV